MEDIEELKKKIKELKKLKAGIAKTDSVDQAVGNTYSKSDVLSGQDVRQDVSDKVKNLVKELSKEGDYRFGVFVGNAGGKRKIIKCPHCEKDMVVAGIKAERKKSTKPASEKQKEWMEFVKLVGQIPENASKSRKEHMKIGKKLRNEGVDIHQMRNINSLQKK